MHRVIYKFVYFRESFYFEGKFISIFLKNMKVYLLLFFYKDLDIQGIGGEGDFLVPQVVRKI